MRPCGVALPRVGQLRPFLGVDVKKHEMERTRKGGNVVVIRRKLGTPLAFRTRQSRELLALQVQTIDGHCRNSPRVSWKVSEEKRIAILRPSGKHFIAVALGNFFESSTIC